MTLESDGYLTLDGILPDVLTKKLVQSINNREHQNETIKVDWHWLVRPNPLYNALLELLRVRASSLGLDVEFSRDAIVFDRREGCQGMYWHQDNDAGIAGEKQRYAWCCYLEPVDRHHGSLMVIPGSHKTTHPIYKTDFYRATQKYRELRDSISPERGVDDSSAQLADPETYELVHSVPDNAVFVEFEKNGIVVTNHAVMHGVVPNAPDRKRPMILWWSYET